jgi:hypothetical protein
MMASCRVILICAFSDILRLLDGLTQRLEFLVSSELPATSQLDYGLSRWQSFLCGKS